MNKYLQAIANLAKRKIFPSPNTTRDWNAVAAVIRMRAFFSATVTQAKLLTKMRRLLLDHLENAVEVIETPDGRQETAYRVGNVADFKEQAAQFLIDEGLAEPEQFRDMSLTNIASPNRLQLIYNTNLEQANTLAFYQHFVLDEDRINRFPAARFTRRPGAVIKRRRHVEAEGEVHRWDDLAFWLYQNAEDIGGFGVPWGPFGFNSYMTAEPVRRAEAERLGLVRPGERVKVPDLSAFGIKKPAQAMAAGVKASLADVPDEIAIKARERLRARLGPQAIGPDGNPSLEALLAVRTKKR